MDLIDQQYLSWNSKSRNINSKISKANPLMLRESGGWRKHWLNSKSQTEFERKDIYQTPYGQKQEIQEFSQMHFNYGKNEV